MFCPKCGAAVADTAVVCPQCGSPTRGAPGPQPVGVNVPNHMVGAILATVFCCLPGGIIAIIYASQVNTKLAVGDIAGAQSASKTAGMWVIISLISPIVGIIAYFLVFVLLGVAAGVSGM